MPDMPFTLILALVLIVSANGINWLFAEESKKYLRLDMLIKLETERMRSKILEELGMTEPPVFPYFSSPLSSDALEVLVEQEESSSKQEDNLAGLLLFPSNRNFECLRNDAISCRRFEFNVPPNTDESKPQFWIYKINSTDSDELSISTSFYISENETTLTMSDAQIAKDDHQNKWISLYLPELQEFTNLHINLTYAVEITGLIMGEDEHNMPFLKVKQHLDRHHRKRRSENSEKVETCKPVPFTVSFDNIGFGDFIEYPKTYQANVCNGYCLRAPNHYETMLDLVFERNKTLEQVHGRCWATCCRPKTYRALRLFYREGNNTIVDRQMVNMVVTSCSCS